jgi:hypothetical protein
VESEGRAISLLADFEIVKESADFGEKKVADLGFVLERWLDFRKRVFQVPMLVGKGKRGPDLFEARRVQPFPLDCLSYWLVPPSNAATKLLWKTPFGSHVRR